MTITEATHALARQARPQRSPSGPPRDPRAPCSWWMPSPGSNPRGWRRSPSCRRCASNWRRGTRHQRSRLSPNLAVRRRLLPAALGAADDTTTVRAIGNLLSGILRTGDCPLPVWEASERARRSPASVGTPRAFGAAITCFPATQSPRELQQYPRRLSESRAPPAIVAARRPDRPSRLRRPAGGAVRHRSGCVGGHARGDQDPRRTGAVGCHHGREPGCAPLAVATHSGARARGRCGLQVAEPSGWSSRAASAAEAAATPSIDTPVCDRRARRACRPGPRSRGCRTRPARTDSRPGRRPSDRRS